jgi:uncharacterized protein YndB with AHSA1/START domain
MSERNAPDVTRRQAERASDHELIVRRTLEGRRDVVWRAWTRAEIFSRWWVPPSFGLTLLSCELDVRVGGQYRLVFRHADEQVAFFGTYREVTPSSRLVWTNEEGGEGEVMTTVTFDEQDGKTLVTVRDAYPSKAALEAALASGSACALPEQLDELQGLLATRSVDGAWER